MITAPDKLCLVIDRGGKSSSSSYLGGRSLKGGKVNCVTSHPNFSGVQSFPESCKSMQFVPRLNNTAGAVLMGSLRSKLV